MKKLQNKNLAELFEIGINLNASEKAHFLKQVNTFDKEKALELSQMYSIEPTEIGFDIATNSLQEKAILNSELELPDKIDKYEVIKILGVGGMGIVYLGERKDINQLVAIKVANTLLPQGARAEAITHEAKILAALKHSNIASLVDWGVYDTHRHFVATEYIDGLSIGQYCIDNSLDAIERIKLFIQVVQAVEYAHNHLVIHRDIKPDNILIEKSGKVKLIDFGVARLMNLESKEYQQTIGAALTPSYASPEQIRGEPLSICSDIYSLGAVLYNILTNERINQEDSTKGVTAENLRTILNNPFEQASKLTNWHKVGKQTFADIILVLGKSLSTDIDQRYQNTQSLKEDLTAIIETKPIKARPPSKWYWIKRYVARNQIASMALITAMILTVSAIGFGGYHWNRTIIKNHEIILANKNLKSYSKFLNTTLKGMDTYSGGNPNITMQDFMSRAVVIYNKEKDVPPEQLAWHAMILSSIYESWGKYEEALKVIELGLGFAKKSHTSDDDISLFTEKALLHASNLDFKSGKEAALQALAIIEKNPETEWRSPYARLALSFSYRESGEMSKSVEIAQSIIDNRKRTEKEIAFATYAQAKVQLRMFDLNSAIKNFEKVLPIYKNIYGENSAQVADTKVMLFWAKNRNRSSNFTNQKQNELTKLYSKIYPKGHPNIAYWSGILAEAYFLNRDIKQAIHHQQESIGILMASSDSPITDIVKAYLNLAKYQIYNDDLNNATKTFQLIDQNLSEKLPNQILAEYYLTKSWLAINRNNTLLAKQSLEDAQKYLVESEFINLVAEYDFRKAQIHALNNEWQLCSQQAQIATQLASQVYPESWLLTDAYKYLQDVCTQNLNNTVENHDLINVKLLNSPWKQEIKLINKIDK